MSKKEILSYLQKNALELRKKFPTLVNARFEDDPPRMVLEFDSKPPPTDKFVKTFNFQVEVVTINKADNKKVAGENPNLAAWKERHKDAIAEPVFDGAEESVNPSSKNAKTVGAYEAWKKRHSGVKIK